MCIALESVLASDYTTIFGGKVHTYVIRCVQWNLYGHQGTNLKCPDYQGVLFSRSAYVLKDYFGTSTKCVDYTGVFTLAASTALKCTS